jgi:hypothetical protein
MADAARRFVLELSARGGAQVKRELADIGESGDRAFQQIISGAQGASRALSILAPIVSALSVGALMRFARSAIDAVGGLGELADQAGVSTDALQALRFAAVQTGLSADELQRGLQALTRRIGDAAAGEKEAKAAFERLGISFRDSSGNARSTESALLDLAAVVRNIENPVERAAAATALLGDRLGQRFIPLLSQGSDGLRDLTEQAIRFGAVADADVIAKADEASDKIAALEQSFSTLARTLAARVAPVLSTIADALNRALTTTEGREDGPGSVAAQLRQTLYRLAELERERDQILERGRQLNVPEERLGQHPRLQGIEREREILLEDYRRLQELDRQRMEAERQRQQRIEQILNPPSRRSVLPSRADSERERVTILPPPDPFTTREVQRALDERETLIMRAGLREIGMTEQVIDAYTRYQARIESLSETVRLLEAIGSPLPDNAVIASAQAALEEYETTVRRIADQTQAWRDVARDLGFTFTSAFEDAIVRGRRLSEVLRGLLQDIARILIRRTITEPVTGWILGQLGGIFGSEHGNVFIGGNVVPFARGGIVTTPTIFPLARGGIGLMGEAGPEAIMPLRRTRGGRLGVEAIGSSVPTVQQTINVTVQGGIGEMDDQQRLAREIGRLARAGVLDAIKEQRRAGGMLWQA